MDSGDSSSSATANKDGYSADEDDLLSVTAGLAKDAAMLFQSRRYMECIDVLNQLLQKKEGDPKVLHNIAVAECFHDGCSDPRKLLEVLNTVKKSEELACASGEQVEVVSSVGNNVTLGSKGSTTSHQVSAANSTRFAYNDEFDTSVATFNSAAILFHLREYGTAMSVLEPLYQNIEPINQTTVLHICLLLLDLALASHDASKAADVIQYLEKAFVDGYMISQGDNSSTTQNQSSNSVVKPLATISNSTVQDPTNLDSNVILNASEYALTRTLLDESLDYETLLSTLDIGRQNLMRPTQLPSSNDLSRSSADRPAPTIDLKLKLHLYKVQLFLLSRNLKAAKREVKLAINIARGRDSSTALLLKSQLEYARGNHRKAIKLLMASSNRTESGMQSMFFNNLGCIYHQLQKYHTSTVFFSKALKSSLSLRSEKPLKLLTFSQDKSSVIMYNCGLQYLTCGKAIVAAHCFRKASLVFHGQPLLWLRMAECCLQALEKGLLSSNETPCDEEIRVHVIGKGKLRHLVVEDETFRNRPFNFTEEKDGLLGNDDQFKLSIPFARQCLFNALHLLDGFVSKSSKDGLPASEEDESSQGVSYNNSNHKNFSSRDSKASSTPVASVHVNTNGDLRESKGTSSISDYTDLCRRKNHMIKQAVMADLAYVELILENPMRALMVAKSLLGLPECSRIYTFLGHVYAAEALCRLNRPKEAAEHLSVYVSDGNNVEFPYSEEDREKWQVENDLGDSEDLQNGNSPKEETQNIVFLNPDKARGTLYVNLAAMAVFQGDLEQAYQFSNEALSTIPKNPQAVLMAVYVDLLLGKESEAVAKLKECSHVRFFPTVTALNRCS